MEQPLVRTNVFLSRFERETLKARASKRGISAAELTREILDKALRAPRRTTAGSMIRKRGAA
jgi:hypothetical protein